MKKYIATTLTVVSCFLRLNGTSQVQFFGEPEAVSSLNTPEGENYLVLNPYKDELAFTREPRVDSTDHHQIFYHIHDTRWRAFVFLDYGNEIYSPLGFASDGSLLVNKVVYKKGAYRGEVIMFREREKKGIKMHIPFLKSTSSMQNGCLSKDGRYMILSMQSNNTYGVEDLYLVRKEKNKWTSPINLGAQINTSFQEITPFLANDNRTLFFATNGREGKGSFDIFYSVRQDESWRSWSVPINIGTPVNTSGAETSFSFLNDNEWAYYVSSQNSDGYGDIKRIKIRENIEEDTDSIETPSFVKKEEILLKVVDKHTRALLPSVLAGDNISIQLSNGMFKTDSTFILNHQKLEIKAKGYLPKIVPRDNLLTPGTHEIELEPIEVGKTIRLSNVLFERGASKMLEGSHEELDLIVEMMNDYPNMKILLKGHTDNQGDPVLNVKLSESRVKAVKDYLISKGVNAYRVTGKGYGGNAPVASNATEKTRKLNRRVEFEIIED